MKINQEYGAINIVVDPDGDRHPGDETKGARNNVAPFLFVTALVFLVATIGFSTSVNPKMMKQQQVQASSDGSMLKSADFPEDHDMNEALFYEEQLVDHFDEDDSNSRGKYWKHRYYKSMKYFGGAGSPIFLVIGGEGALNNGMLYPFVTEVLAKKFGAAVVQPEHRFYGPYQPMEYGTATNQDLLQLLTPQQAMADMIRLVQVQLRSSGSDLADCSMDRSSPDYCPLITIGASYPGFLSAMFRIVYRDIVDAAYASSAPLLMYAQVVPDNNIYYDIVTAAAERASPGCAHSVRATLTEVVQEVKDASSLEEATRLVGICSSKEFFPKEITSQQQLADQLALMAVYGFANYDMGCYPPSNKTAMYKICQAFQDPELNSLDTMKSYFRSKLVQEWQEENECDLVAKECTLEDEQAFLEETYKGRDCYDLRLDVEDNEAEDNDNKVQEFDGMPYDDMKSWDFQACTNIIFRCGTSASSMFPEHPATYEELNADCAKQYGSDVVPRPTELVELWGFDDLLAINATRILFTNGLQDMWSGGSYLEDLSDSLLAINLENGAHHSDLTHEAPGPNDTEDIQQGHEQIQVILGKWIEEIKEESK
mmetsp:Transcript_4541/g.6545  ORF Transcript_4541/g.6545 Transcript_4541/m.6545 type:complete len:597 (-) Transcript_4541:1298-3088(-)|eukprot:CAMPEP_0194217932 /NCGR_PEP_ID=MMETSP0156-20130528/22558_1 /TAXON_ID=33649 /ORGANISM="Thalassionema nitzschioides, Strain L26-B" /LENGTH=596 /DNA_ID=CAMNT_0038947109 /DNA_START=101 /DNA_END=1891 /DNA_ORIENTATION=+